MPGSQTVKLGWWHAYALGENGWNTGYDANWRKMDALVQASVKDKDLAAPPGSPANGDCYIVAASPTGAWAGQAGKVARWSGTVWEFFTPMKGWSFHVDDENVFYKYTGAAWVIQSSGGGSSTTAIPIACSDETTALTTGAAKVTFRMPFGMNLTAVRASLTTAQTSGSLLTVNIKANGTAILSTKITLDNTEKTSTTAATPPVIGTSAIADDAEITIDIDQIGDGTAKGLKVYLIGVPA